jgi:hypothetical protein
MTISLLWIQNGPTEPHTCPAAVTCTRRDACRTSRHAWAGPGDVSICGYCRAVSIFEADGRLRWRRARNARSCRIGRSCTCSSGSRRDAELAGTSRRWARDRLGHSRYSRPQRLDEDA